MLDAHCSHLSPHREQVCHLPILESWCVKQEHGLRGVWIAWPQGSYEIKHTALTIPGCHLGPPGTPPMSSEAPLPWTHPQPPKEKVLQESDIQQIRGILCTSHGHGNKSLSFSLGLQEGSIHACFPRREERPWSFRNSSFPKSCLGGWHKTRDLTGKKHVPVGYVFTKCPADTDLSGVRSCLLSTPGAPAPRTMLAHSRCSLSTSSVEGGVSVPGRTFQRVSWFPPKLVLSNILICVGRVCLQHLVMGKSSPLPKTVFHIHCRLIL